jgi:tol-pal system protein YbgF
MRYGLLICLVIISSPAMAGLFADDDARKQVQQLETRIVKLEKALASVDGEKEQYIRTSLDLQMQLEAVNTELRKLRGQNEELVHNLQDAEKRQKDFYIDLDARLRRFETAEASAQNERAAPVTKEVTADPANESRAFEAAYSFYKAENYQSAADAFREFLRRYPKTMHEANVHYWMGNSYFLLKDFKSSLSSYEILVGKYEDHPRAAEAMLNIAECQMALSSKTAAKKTLKQLISQFPGSDAADKAKKRLATIK